MKRNLQEIFDMILSELKEVDFRGKVNSSKSEKITNKNYVVSSVEEILSIANEHNVSMCKKNGAIFMYNGEYWLNGECEIFKSFLSDAALKMGVPFVESKHHQFKDELYKQLFASANLPRIKDDNGEVLINLQNGTFVFAADGHYLRDFEKEDFLTYQLPFAYDEEATSPLFDKYLEQVLPDKSLQDILAEYIGYIFTKGLKLEKCLLLYGNGANGKSVFFDIVNALISRENISNFNLGNLAEERNRAMITNKLLNYGSELRGNIESDILKQLSSGEPIVCRHLYGHPFMCENYARLMFNCNELPKRTEATEAYFRRFLIIPFDVTIPEEQRDVELSKKIISNELAGIFNWVLKGLERLMVNKRFTNSEQARIMLEEFKRESDSLAMFLAEEGFKASTQCLLPLKELYHEYKTYCSEIGRIALSLTNFSKRLRLMKFELTRQSFGTVVYIEKEKNDSFPPALPALPTSPASPKSPTTFEYIGARSVGNVGTKEDLNLPF